MGRIVCNNDCDNCNFTYWKWITENGLLIGGSSITLHDCDKVAESGE